MLLANVMLPKIQRQAVLLLHTMNVKINHIAAFASPKEWLHLVPLLINIKILLFNDVH